jgi:hypothetical protein
MNKSGFEMVTNTAESTVFRAIPEIQTSLRLITSERQIFLKRMQKCQCYFQNDTDTSPLSFYLHQYGVLEI